MKGTYCVFTLWVSNGHHEWQLNDGIVGLFKIIIIIIIKKKTLFGYVQHWNGSLYRWHKFGIFYSEHYLALCLVHQAFMKIVWLKKEQEMFTVL